MVQTIEHFIKEGVISRKKPHLQISRRRKISSVITFFTHSDGSLFCSWNFESKTALKEWWNHKR